MELLEKCSELGSKFNHENHIFYFLMPSGCNLNVIIPSIASIQGGIDGWIESMDTIINNFVLLS